MWACLWCWPGHCSSSVASWHWALLGRSSVRTSSSPSPPNPGVCFSISSSRVLQIVMRSVPTGYCFYSNSSHTETGPGDAAHNLRLMKRFKNKSLVHWLLMWWRFLLVSVLIKRLGESPPPRPSPPPSPRQPTQPAQLWSNSAVCYSGVCLLFSK